MQFSLSEQSTSRRAQIFSNNVLVRAKSSSSTNTDKNVTDLKKYWMWLQLLIRLKLRMGGGLSNAGNEVTGSCLDRSMILLMSCPSLHKLYLQCASFHPPTKTLPSCVPATHHRQYILLASKP